MTYISDSSYAAPGYVVISLSLPSPARGEGFKSPSLDERGQGEGVLCAEIVGGAAGLRKADTVSLTKL